RCGASVATGLPRLLGGAAPSGAQRGRPTRWQRSPRRAVTKPNSDRSSTVRWRSRRRLTREARPTARAWRPNCSRGKARQPPARRRADERGVAVASYVLSYLEYKRGDMPGAEAAIARADERGLAAGAFAHGNFLGMAGDRPGAQAAWRRARRLAVAQADPATRVAAQRALHPPAATWLRAHRLRTLLLAIGLVTIGVFVAVPAAVAVLLALVAVYAWHRPLVPGSPMNAAPIDSGTGLNIGGLSVSGDVGVPMEPSDQATAVRPASLRDTAYARMLPVALGGAAIVFAAWAARAIDIDRILRGGSLAYALTIVWLVAWAAPSVLAPPSGDEIASPAPE